MTDFNPRPREGGDLSERGRNEDGNISIHAPAKGATLSERGRNEDGNISIHAPAKGAT